MTVIIGLKAKTRTYLAADRRITDDGFRDSTSKLGQLSPGVYGAFCGEVSPIQHFLERCRPKAPELVNIDWARKVLKPHLRTVAKKFGWVTKRVPGETPEIFPVDGILSVRGVLVAFDSTGAVWLPERMYECLGSGADFAKGAMAVQVGKLTWLGEANYRAALEGAVAATAEHETTVGRACDILVDDSA